MRAAALAFPFLLAPLLAACAPAPAPPATASPPPPPAAARPAEQASLDPVATRLVERVVDGDTLVLAGGERVRVLGIDALEMKHPDPAVHALAVRARQQLASGVEGRRVAIVAGLPGVTRDRYGRLLAYVEIPGERSADVGERLVAQGLARPYPSAHPRAAAYRLRASEARAERRGLWQPGVLRALGLLGDDVAIAAAGSRTGQVVRVTGVLGADARGPKVHRLRLDDGAASLDLVVFPSRYDEIPEDLVRGWVGRSAVTGRVSTYRGRPQIVIEDPFQVESPLP